MLKLKPIESSKVLKLVAAAQAGIATDTLGLTATGALVTAVAPPPAQPSSPVVKAAAAATAPKTPAAAASAPAAAPAVAPPAKKPAAKPVAAKPAAPKPAEQAAQAQVPPENRVLQILQQQVPADDGPAEVFISYRWA